MSGRARRLRQTVVVAAAGAMTVGLTQTASSPTSQSVIDLQSSRVISIRSLGTEAKPEGEVRLTNLAPNINAWLLLELAVGKTSRTFNLENPDPGALKVELDPDNAGSLRLTAKSGVSTCRLWEADGSSELDRNVSLKIPYNAICDGKLYVRSRAEGRASAKEQVADFLRRNIWGGDKIMAMAKDALYQDAFIMTPAAVETLANQATAVIGTGAAAVLPRSAGPAPARLSEKAAELSVRPQELGIEFKRNEGEGATRTEPMKLGQWSEVSGVRGVFLSAIEPGYVADDILKSHTDRVAKLDSTESRALDYMVAFDLEAYDLDFALGTDHPSAEWSSRVSDGVKPDGWQGPDGFKTYAPLVASGQIPPWVASHVIASFTGGFKRLHGGFKWGPLASANNGSHYGFMENGVVMSRINPGLATLTIDKAGQVGMRTWTEADNQTLSTLRHVRQNGVPIVETDPATKTGIPGALVKNWGGGNWSGSDQSQLRALRAGLCVTENAGRRFLVYGYFSSATPSAMARVFQAYGCTYAMHLDMNALEHTYLAVYRHDQPEAATQHLIEGMNVLDRAPGSGKNIPRFLGIADNRDFFYLTPKGTRRWVD